MRIERDDYGLGTVIMAQNRRGDFLCVNVRKQWGFINRKNRERKADCDRGIF